MRIRITLFILLVASSALAQEPELTLQLPARKVVRVPASLRDFAAPFELAPLATCNESEPNETLENADTITLPGDCNGNVGSSDSFSIRINFNDGTSDGIEDVYKLVLTQTKDINLDLTWSSSAADLDLFVFRQNGSSLESVAGATTDGAAAESAGTGPLSPGTYFIGVSAVTGSSPYNLAFAEFTTSSSCGEDTTTMCLNNGRFRARATYTANNQSGSAGAVRLTGDTGFFWFFNNANVEAVVKVLNGCGLNNRWWVFASGLTDVQVRLTITDTQTGTTKEYTTPGGGAFQPIQDTNAFATCSSCTYSLSTSSASFGSSGGSGGVSVITQGGCSWTAVSNSSFITITSGGSGVGGGTVNYSVAANTSSSARTGTITVAGQTFTINQSGTSGGGSFNGTWSGTTSQGKSISFTVTNNLITNVSVGWRASGGCTVDGDSSVTYTPGRPITGNSFTLTLSGPQGFTINGTFNSSSSASGNASFTFNQPFPPCSATGSATWSATR
jgi:hypothetical protein